MSWVEWKWKSKSNLKIKPVIFWNYFILLLFRSFEETELTDENLSKYDLILKELQNNIQKWL